ncbi:Alpha/Beta hydrolase protein [Fomitopsis serialis]|uniref:Alpha/Beta hydrolase protein n=1 Tax=Fomitopsis serialis TaxID=139415 RepID=UPI002007C8DA|nr:Alpha/Beta hydrolase protein [Neoantrodia serialis]KAH9929190.1 Alpha/Beta hydrolase protein [Neoantrodia serialis]
MDVVANMKVTAIRLINTSTMNAFVPHLEKRRAEIEGVHVKTFKYGTAERHMLDVYYPPEDICPTSGRKIPVLHFFYGGSFVRGSRRLPPPYDLGYASTGAYFAKRGILTVIADYRLVPNVKYPQPIEDVRDTISWVIANGADEIVGQTGIQADFDHVFLLGHSAGTIYISTLLFHPTLLTPQLRSHIRGIVLKSGMFRFPRDKRMGLEDPLLQLYGNWFEVEANMPIALLNQASDEVLKGFPEVIMLAREQEPDGFFVTNEERVREALEARLGRDIPLNFMKGHNHISPHWALWSGREQEKNGRRRLPDGFTTKLRQHNMCLARVNAVVYY